MCRHHWMLPSPNGSPVITAHCRDCGETREEHTSMVTVDVMLKHHSREEMKMFRIGRADDRDNRFRAAALVIERPGNREGATWAR